MTCFLIACFLTLLTLLGGIGLAVWRLARHVRRYPEAGKNLVELVAAIFADEPEREETPEQENREAKPAKDGKGKSRGTLC